MMPLVEVNDQIRKITEFENVYKLRKSTQLYIMETEIFIKL